MGRTNTSKRFERKKICGVWHCRVKCRCCGGLIWTQLKPLAEDAICNDCDTTYCREIGVGRGEDMPSRIEMDEG